MAVSPTIANETEVVRDTVPTGVRWLLLSLTLLLAALAAYQLVYFVPRCSWVMQNLGVKEPDYLRRLLRIPEWAALAAILVFGAIAVWQRGSVGRSALLTTLALAINVACLICILGGLFQVLSRVQSP